MAVGAGGDVVGQGADGVAVGVGGDVVGTGKVGPGDGGAVGKGRGDTVGPGPGAVGHGTGDGVGRGGGGLSPPLASASGAAVTPIAARTATPTPANTVRRRAAPRIARCERFKGMASSERSRSAALITSSMGVVTF
jgi:hypothetical protein